ncbi:SURF1 family protein [Piscinibacter sp. HJYY11]|uniref:SURF1 family protein n=1 Tax=Piscinibacter sp. HJYY11 TaxID=2801333 RepID=UPI00191FAC83|nr:SURF1 family protein [Piscinibacter sp. HJYY11]MBL0730202.1 SURF1 family protein [Piscinibacter sp. HJYY11]
MAGWLADPRRRAVIVLVATLVGMGATARLGVWQLNRAAQKEALQTALDTRGTLPPLRMDSLPPSETLAQAEHHRPVVLRGEWKQGATVFLDNRQMNGRPGFFVMTPLLLSPGDAVLVQRGWVPRDVQDRTRVPAVPTPSGLVEVTGRLAPPPARLYDFAPGAAASGPIRQNLVLAEHSRELGVTLRPWTVLQSDEAAPVRDGLSRQWPRPAADVHKHYGYAFQWFGLCALIAGLYVWFQVLRPRFQRRR